MDVLQTLQQKEIEDNDKLLKKLNMRYGIRIWSKCISHKCKVCIEGR